MTSKGSLEVKVCAIQMCSSHLVDDNLRDAYRFIQEAARAGARLAVLPENFAIMGIDPGDKLSHKETFGVGPIQTFLSNAARENKIWLVGGTIPITGEDEKRARAASLVYDDKGELVARYDKIHMFDVQVSATEIHHESKEIEPGHASDYVVVQTPVGKLGLAVCFDVRFATQFRALFEKGAEIIVLPSAFTVPTGKAHWHVLTRSRAIETFCYFIGAAQGGTHTSGRKTYGHSIIIDPWGTVIAEKNDDAPGNIYAEIDLAELHRIRERVPIGVS